ncbi:AIR synthase related protein [Peribacillus frigoritolerans]|uniref:AIR synthase related protein n=1 Tax=Peribacillus frigoritolerans TaxID=450367 RepID=UPI002EAD046A|nr:AIR synthase related protein [Peribacillus frigoritolerans]
MSDFQKLIDKLQRDVALYRKKAIAPPIAEFSKLWNFGHTVDPIGDDAAILRFNDEYLLFSCDGILPQLVQEEPYWAGYCSVLVSASDIYAMGGRPFAMVNLLSSPDEETSVLIAKGMAEGCRLLGIPMVGGHFMPQEASGVATAIIGKASHVLRATQGKPEQLLVAAVDLEGEQYKHYGHWNSTTMISPEKMQGKLEVLPRLAETSLGHAARDISNAGILGTLAMLAENSGCGAEIDLGQMPKPYSVEMDRWLRMYPGYGFILSIDTGDEQEVIKMFHEQGIAAAVIGKLTESRKVMIRSEEESALYMDLEKDVLVVGENG